MFEIERTGAVRFIRWRGLTRLIWFGIWKHGRTLRVGEGMLLVACGGRALVIALGR